MPQIKLNIDRFDDLLGDEFFGFFEGNPIWLYRALGHFVFETKEECLQDIEKKIRLKEIDQGNADEMRLRANDAYMSHEEGFKWVKANMTVKQVKEMRGAILKELQSQAVPLENRKPSETP